LGEVDILAQDGQTLVAVEVKTKTSNLLGSPLEMITPAKQKKLILLANELSVACKTNNVRIDVIAIIAVPNEAPRISYYKGAVEFNG